MTNNGQGSDSRDGRRSHSDKQEDSSTRGGRAAWPKILGAIVLVVILAAIYHIYFAERERERPIIVSGREIAEESVKFLRTLSDNGQLYGHLECDLEDNCELKNPGQPTVASWHLYGGIALLNLGKWDEGKAYYQHFFDEWKRTSSGYPEVFNAYQVFDLYRATNDDRLLTGYWSLRQGILNVAKNRYVRLGTPEDPDMMYAIMAVQLARYVSILRSKPLVEKLAAADPPSFPNGDAIAALEDSLLETISGLMERLRNPPADSPFVILPKDSELQRFTCWGSLAKYALYGATGQKEYLDEVIVEMKKARFRDRRMEDMQIPGLQIALPCLELLVALNQRDPAFTSDVKFLMEEVFLPGWDSGKRPLCKGDGGFFAIPRPNERLAICGGNPKTVSDNAWVSFILSQVPEARFELR